MQSEPVRTYHDLFASLSDTPLYAAPWWLDATCGAKGWEAVIGYDDTGKPATALPYHLTHIHGLTALITPPFTQWVSLLAAGNANDSSSLTLLSEIPKTSILDLSLKPDASLQLQESPFPVALKYSYIIPLYPDMNMTMAGYSEGLRRNIRQAEKSYSLMESDDISGFLALCRQSYHQQKMKPPPWLDQVIPLVYAGLLAHHCGTLTVASSQGKISAGILTGWDTSSSYYLAGGRTADEQGASAHALLLDHAIKAARLRGTTFDFEGSMHPGIANFFQSFGAIPISYWNIRKYTGAGRLWSVLNK